MSVVNRMLRDIDRRLGTEGTAPAVAHAGIRSVPPPASPAQAGWKPRLAVATLFILALAALAFDRWREGQRAPRATIAARPAAKPVPAKAKPVASEAQPILVAAREIASPPPPAANVPAKITPAAIGPVKVAPAAANDPAPVRERRMARPAAVLSPADNLKLSLQLSAPAPVAASVAVAAPASPRNTVPAALAPSPRAGVPARQVAAEETVQAARALWSEGGRGAALATLREALAAAEASRNDAAAASLARELARLEVAGDRPQAALDLLRRLERHFVDDGDAWALRGNAAQRLALHAEAAQCYLAALRAGPVEGKWMLGAAISLAADGDIATAKAWVERARERGPIPPMIAAYLQQLGIATSR